jgi:hypothetical protein
MATNCFSIKILELFLICSGPRRKQTIIKENLIGIIKREIDEIDI